ncbi:MAG: thiamine ABC transporter substrate-binding protein [Candidatus Heimdallarchaeota archaeon]|nr:thiamine ABC transporter substrate-binding protein [Candidatus Heimdallarchaeota archaeon]
MNRSVLIASSIFLIVIIVAAGIYVFSQDSDEDALVIYTYNSLLADPGYEFDRAFETYKGLLPGSVKVVYADDAAGIITRATVEKNSPIADVLIGIDNTLVSKARINGILEPYQAHGVNDLVEGLVDGLASDYLLTPYDYGVISLWYLKDRLVGNPSSSFMMEDLMDPIFSSQLIVENPNLSSPGLGFLLSTIAIYGDDTSGVTGVINGDWESFWSNISSEARLVDSWGAGLELMYEEAEARPMMVSYTSSPAYSYCQYNDNSTDVLLSNEGSMKNLGWQQIEGLGLVKNAPHSALAKEFIDWFISDTVQNQIYGNQWMYPAKKSIIAPDCYSVVTPFNQITPLNSYISQEVLSNNLDNWLDRWEVAYATS